MNAVEIEEAMPKLPVARALWVPRPDFKRGAQAWASFRRDAAPSRVD